MSAVATVPVMSVSVGLLLVIVKVNVPSSSTLISLIDKMAVSLFSIVPKPLASPPVKVARDGIAGAAEQGVAEIDVEVLVILDNVVVGHSHRHGVDPDRPSPR